MRVIDEMGMKAKAASRSLAIAGELKNTALKAIAAALIDNTDKIIEANRIDLENGEKNGLSAALIDRLRLDEGRTVALMRRAWDEGYVRETGTAVMGTSQRYGDPQGPCAHGRDRDYL